jgi:hypothetical protein
MRVLTPEIEKAHDKAVFAAGIKYGLVGLAIGLGGVTLAHRRYPTFRAMTLPFKAFLTSSTATAFGIIAADHMSIQFEHENNEKLANYSEATARARAEALASETAYQSMMRWGRENRYKIVAATWAAGMGASWHYINKDKLLTTSQKVVQARVYAQALALAALVATAAFEMSDATKGEGRWDTVMVADPHDPEHKRMIEKQVHRELYTGQDLWKDMVAAEERRLAALKEKRDEAAAKLQK